MLHLAEGAPGAGGKDWQKRMYLTIQPRLMSAKSGSTVYNMAAMVGLLTHGKTRAFLHILHRHSERPIRHFWAEVGCPKEGWREETDAERSKPRTPSTASRHPDRKHPEVIHPVGHPSARSTAFSPLICERYSQPRSACHDPKPHSKDGSNNEHLRRRLTPSLVRPGLSDEMGSEPRLPAANRQQCGSPPGHQSRFPTLQHR